MFFYAYNNSSTTHSLGEGREANKGVFCKRYIASNSTR